MNRAFRAIRRSDVVALVIEAMACITEQVLYLKLLWGNHIYENVGNFWLDMHLLHSFSFFIFFFINFVYHVHEDIITSYSEAEK